MKEENKIAQENILKYSKPIYALALNLIGGNCDKAYEVTVGTFADFYQHQNSEDDTLAALCQCLYKRVAESEWMPTANYPDYLTVPEERKRLLVFISRAMMELPLNARWVILLRDQLHLPNASIAAILKIKPSAVKVMTLESRNALQTKVREFFEKQV